MLNIPTPTQEIPMKNFILAALLGVSVAVTGAVSAQADSFAVHGYQGTNYGR